MKAADAVDETPAARVGAAVVYSSSMRQMAITLMQPFADLGDTDAMFNLGALLSSRDPDEARWRFEQAVDRGDIGAMNNLGVLLAGSDPDEARRRFEQAADLGDTGAMFNLGVLLAGSDPH